MTTPTLPAVGTLFASEHIDTRPCPTCAEPITDTNRGQVHWEALPNGAKTAYGECGTGDQGALFGSLRSTVLQ
ncbi:MAG: hypothetical protein HYZ39_16325 [Mycolicibacterium cosmeticum]|nr:hypothetical protein [Mycolicibacterium cosmeticum]